MLGRISSPGLPQMGGTVLIHRIAATLARPRQATFAKVGNALRGKGHAQRYSLLQCNNKRLFKDFGHNRGRTSVAQQTKYFLANIGKVKTVNDLINNSKLYTYVMTAFGLSDMMNAKG